MLDWPIDTEHGGRRTGRLRTVSFNSRRWHTSRVSIQVVIVSSEYLPVTGGIASYAVTLSKALSRFAQVFVIAPDCTTSDCRPAFSGTGESLSLVPTYRGRGSVEPLVQTAAHNAILPFAWRAIRRLVSDAAVVHLCSPLSGTLLLPLIGEFPSVTTIHSSVSGDVRETYRALRHGQMRLRPTDLGKTLFYPFLRAQESLTIRRSDRVISVAEMTADSARLPKTISGRIRVVQNGVDTDLFRPRITAHLPHNNRTLFCGRLTPSKGIHIAIEAAMILSKRRKDIEFVFAGQGDVEYYQRMADRKCGVGICRFVGPVPYFRMPNLLTSCDVLLSASLYESSPMSFLEALSCGTPVVSFETPASIRLISASRGGLTAAKSTAHDLADSLQFLLDNPSEGREMGLRGREYVEMHHSAESMARHTIEIYNEAIDEH